MPQNTRLVGIAIALLPLLLVSADFPLSQRSQEVKHFTLMFTNDEHSSLLPTASDRGGFARLASAVLQVRASKAARGEPTLLVSTGDFWGGAPFSWLGLVGKSPELSLMQSLGYDVVTLGNHEFDCGPSVLTRYLQSAGYPLAAAKTVIVASNTNLSKVPDLSSLRISSSHLRVLSNGLRVGFFGVIGEKAATVAQHAAPVAFDSVLTTARQQVSELRSAGADIIVALSHSGLQTDKVMAKQVSGIDIIVGGHCHTVIESPLRVNNTYIVQAGENLNYLGVLEIAYHPHTQELSVRSKHNCLIELDQAIKPNPHYHRLIENYVVELNTMIARLTDGKYHSIYEPVALSDFVVSNSPSLTETPLGNMIADAIREAAERATGRKVDFAFQASGLLRGSLQPRDGKIILYDLLSLIGSGLGPDRLPGYPLVSVYLTGEEIYRLMDLSILLAQSVSKTAFVHVSGLRCCYDPSRALLLKSPFWKIPVPLLQAVLRIDVLRQDGRYSPLSRTDRNLYHVVTDLRRADYLPLLQRYLPQVSIVPKNRDGIPVELEQCIIYYKGRELKAWQALLEYLHPESESTGAVAAVPSAYSTTQGRIIVEMRPPLYLHYVLGVIAVALLIRCLSCK